MINKDVFPSRFSNSKTSGYIGLRKKNFLVLHFPIDKFFFSGHITHIKTCFVKRNSIFSFQNKICESDTKSLFIISFTFGFVISFLSLFQKIKNGCSSLRSSYNSPPHQAKNHPPRLPQAPNHPQKESRPPQTQGPTCFHSRNPRSGLEGNTNKSQDHWTEKGNFYSFKRAL